MGGINVTTALGEPLKAEIDLVAVGKAEKNKMSARLASPDVFKGAGLDYPVTLPKLKFQIETRANGEPYLKVTTAQPVNEPFRQFAGGIDLVVRQLLREYTFLLDPPGFKPEQPKAAGSDSRLSRVLAARMNPESVAEKEQPMPMRATAPMDEKVFVGCCCIGNMLAARKSLSESSKCRMLHGHHQGEARRHFEQNCARDKISRCQSWNA